MEYTKDLILDVRYGEVKRRKAFKSRTSKITAKLIKHKIVTASVFIAGILIAIDVLLVMNFVQILEIY